MPVIPERFASAPSRFANARGHVAYAVAYFLFGLMLFFMLADTVIAIVRAW